MKEKITNKINLAVTNKEKGITLIALVVTIVVLLILAGVSIVVLFGDNGIIKTAEEVADKTQKTADKDNEDLEKINEAITSQNWGETTKPITPPKEHVNPTKGEKIPVQNNGKNNVEWKETIKEGENEKTLTAKIPVGFSVVKDVGEDINDITNGLVISDEEDDDLDNTAGGNQFVWIPVEADDNENTPHFRRIEGFSNDKRESMLLDCQEAGKEGITTTESIAMYQSVAENGGFYIARFEAGVAEAKQVLTNETQMPIPDGKTKPVSKKEVSPWSCIQWGGTKTDKATDTFVGNDNANGAVKVARSMYLETEAYGAISCLCYGVQWDAIMQYIEPQYIHYQKDKEEEKVPQNSFVRNSEQKGNYSGNLELTGQYELKHIYDLAGNVFEWTMECYGTEARVVRGGGFERNAIERPASTRMNVYVRNESIYDYYSFIRI